MWSPKPVNESIVNRSCRVVRARRVQQGVSGRQISGSCGKSSRVATTAKRENDFSKQTMAMKASRMNHRPNAVDIHQNKLVRTKNHHSFKRKKGTYERESLRGGRPGSHRDSSRRAANTIADNPGGWTTTKTICCYDNDNCNYININIQY